MATHIDACFTCRFRLPIAIGDSVVRGIDRVDREFRVSPISTLMNDNVRIIEKPDLTDTELNDLFSASWTAHTARAFGPILQRSLTYFGAYQDAQLVGFVNVAWDGGDHAFLLDPTVLPACRRRGIGLALVTAATASTTRGAEWLHVDYDAVLDDFYRRAGFRPTHAGLIHLLPTQTTNPPGTGPATVTFTTGC